MYHRQKIDEHLKKEFNRLCNIPSEKDRMYALNKFFHLHLTGTRLSDYKIIFTSDDPVSTTIKDEATGAIYSAVYENNSTLLKAQAEHIKFVNVNISLSNDLEREQTYFRFVDPLHDQPLHDEVHATFEGRYSLTLVKKYPTWYRPIESGVYLTLSDTKEYYTKFHTMITDLDNEFFKTNPTTLSSFDAVVKEFIESKNIFFEKIMSKLKK